MKAPFKTTTTYLNYATRLMERYSKQLDTLGKHRACARQEKITIPSVQVNQGGQAIVGTVNIQKGGELPDQ